MPNRGRTPRRATNDNLRAPVQDAVPWLEVTLIALVLATGILAGGFALATLWHQADSDGVETLE